MLTPEEELKLEYFTKIIKDSKADYRLPQLGAYDLEWLAEKLKETNDEFKKFKEEVYKVVDKEWEAHWKRNKEEDDIEEAVLTDSDIVTNPYSNPKNEISDRFYPR